MDEAKAGPCSVSVQEGHRMLGAMAISRPAEQLPDYVLKSGPQRVEILHGNLAVVLHFRFSKQ